ncbi:MAG: ABC transporter ATP-binding protein [Frankia sp.]
MDALVVQDLSVQYGGFRAVDAVSLTVQNGTVQGLIGPNGAGKTSLFNAICGYVRSRKGRVLVYGEVVNPGSPYLAWKAGIARTFQQAELFWTLTAREHLDLARRKAVRRRQDPPSTADLIELVGLSDIADQTVATLPLGSMRLVELGRALATGSSLLLMDEPCSGLDRAETTQFEQVLRSVQVGLSLTLLIVEHDMEFVLSIAERILVLDSGRIIADGTPDEVMSNTAVHEAYLGVVHRDDASDGRPVNDSLGASR